MAFFVMNRRIQNQNPNRRNLSVLLSCVETSECCDQEDGSVERNSSRFYSGNNPHHPQVLIQMIRFSLARYICHWLVLFWRLECLAKLFFRAICPSKCTIHKARIVPDLPDLFASQEFVCSSVCMRVFVCAGVKNDDLGQTVCLLCSSASNSPGPTSKFKDGYC